MSSCMVIQEYDRLTFAVDTARSMGDGTGIRYRLYGDKAQKVHKVGADMVFVGGRDECVVKLTGALTSFINNENHVDIELLKQYLKKEFPKPENKYIDGLNDIGVMVLSIKNNESIVYNLGQKNEYETIVNKPARDNVKLLVDGYEIAKIFGYAIKLLRTLRMESCRELETFINVYQNNYSEGVGGYIQIYSMDPTGCRILKEHKLDEKDLKCIIRKSDLEKATVFNPSLQAHIADTQIQGVKVTCTKIEGVNININQIGSYGTISIIDGHVEASNVVADRVNANWVYAGEIDADQITSGTISGDKISGGTITGVIINGGTFNSSDTYGSLNIEGAFIRGRDAAGNIKLDIDAAGNITGGNVDCSTINGRTPITVGNIGQQSVSYAADAGTADLASSAFSLLSASYTRSAHISANDNFIPDSPGMYIGSSGSPWAGGYGVNDWIQTSDERKKYDIKEPDARFLMFAKKLIPYMFKMNQGTSGRDHMGFLAQQVKQIKDECGISDLEFAGWIAAPIYEKKLLDEEGNETEAYDTTSEIIDYDYGLRYDEFIPLLLIRIMDQEERLAAIEKQINIHSDSEPEVSPAGL